MTALVTATGLAIAGRLEATRLSLEAGTLTCLVGPNGGGKTSLLHALAGIGHPSGTVRIDGMDARSLGPGQRPRFCAYLPATREVAWPLTAADVAALGLADEDEPGRIDEVLAELGLSDMATRRLDRMSTGERSRVLIARALAARPKLLLLDEPVANLDPLWQLRLMDKLRAIAHEGNRALLVAMHDLELSRRYADRLIIMQGGAIAADGDPAELLGGPYIPTIFGIERSDGAWRPVG
ncbi:ABC transporter ATP-binding protein [Allosphingosinicella sp.]|uniref:ABC transporter ATP-binding protein n=1 Tax=Allosphingosinicella sp. TaxID=2823234 RepID=UPI002FC1DC09